MSPPCPFCDYAAGRYTRDLIVFEDEHVLVVPSRRQKGNNRGHCLVVTRRHCANVYELRREMAAPVLLAVSAAARATKRAFHADGVSVRQNNDPAGGQDVFHLHVHVVPRYAGDDFATAPYDLVDEETRIAQAKALHDAWTP